MFDLADVLDNTARADNFQELGIFKFAKLFFAERFTDDFAILHYKMCKLLFKLLDPGFSEATDRNAYFLVHREAAKTTLGTFLLPAFLIYLKGHTIFVSGEMLDRDNPKEIVEIKIDERFIVIASATAAMSENFVTNLRSAIETNAALAKIFGEKNPKMIEIDDDAVRTVDKTWRKQMFITADGTIVRGVGMGQQIRGANIGGSRPTLIICDDIYSEDNSKTEYSRKEVKRWFFNAVVNSLDSHKGKMLLLGTMMHPDSVFKEVKANPMWFGIEVPIISEKELNIILTELREMEKFDDDDWYTTPQAMKWFSDKELEMTTMSWQKRHRLRKIIIRYKEKLRSQDLNWFYQEFMNQPIAPETLLVQEHSFYRTDLSFYKNNGQQYVKFQFEQAMWFGPVNLYVGLDPASSMATTSDDTVISVAGLAYCTPQILGFDVESTGQKLIKRVFPIIAHIEGGKYAINDYEGMPGMVQAIARLCNRFKIERVKIETIGTQEQIAREVRSALRNEMVVSQWSNSDKKERILSILLSLVQKHKYIICSKREPLIDKLFYQLLTIGMADHDDYPDSLAIALHDAREPYSASFVMEAEETITKTRYDVLHELYGERAWEYL